MTRPATPSWFRPPRRVLFVTHPNIGDAVNLTAALRWMRLTWPASEIVAVTSAVAAPILASCGHADQVWHRPEGWLQQVRFVAQVRARGFDLAVFAYPQRTLLRAVRRAGVGHVVGIRDRPDEPWDFAVSERTEGVKVPGEVADLLSALGCDCSDARPEVRPGPREASRIDALLQGKTGPRVALHTGASHPSKRWPAERFGAIASRLAEDGVTPVFIGGPSETRVVDGVIPEGAIRAEGRLTLLETAELLRRCEALLSADSGPVHLAASGGVPCVVLFGPTQSRLHAPYGHGHVLLQGACARQCAGLDACDGSCLRGLSVDAVWRALAGRVSPSGRPA